MSQQNQPTKQHTNQPTKQHTKQCKKCHTGYDLNEDNFYIVRMTNKNGNEVNYFQSICKKCQKCQYVKRGCKLSRLPYEQKHVLLTILRAGDKKLFIDYCATLDNIDRTLAYKWWKRTDLNEILSN